MQEGLVKLGELVERTGARTYEAILDLRKAIGGRDEA